MSFSSVNQCNLSSYYTSILQGTFGENTDGVWVHFPGGHGLTHKCKKDTLYG